MDLRLKNGAIMQVVGPSGAGKTMFICNLLSNSRIFTNKPKKIFWFIGSKDGETGITKSKIDNIKNVKFIEGFISGWMDLPQKNDVIIIDDLFQESNKEKDFNNLFTKIARHRQVFVIYVTQNLFHQGGAHRTRNLNVHYLVLFKNPRHQTTIDFVSRQAFPNNRKFLIEVFLRMRLQMCRMATFL